MPASRTRPVFFSLIISALVISAFAYYLYLNADKYLDLLHISIPGVILLFLISLTFPLFNGLQNIYLYRNLGADISYRDGFFLTAASTLANQLPISGGIVSKGVYLKYKYNLSYTQFISSTFALYFCFVSTNGFVGVVILLGWFFINKTAISPVLFIAYIIMASCILVFQLPLDRVRLPGKVHVWFQQAVEGLTFVSRNLLVLMKIVSLQVVLVFLLALRYWMAFHMLSQNVTIAQTLLFASATILTQLVSIAPGGLGVREAIVGAVASMMGLDPGVSMIAVGLDRLISTVMVVLTGWLSMLALGRQFTEFNSIE